MSGDPTASATPASTHVPGRGGALAIQIVPVTPFQQNCALLFDEETLTGVVVDPGGDVDKIMEAIAAAGLSVEAIWLTHGHLDHAGGAMALKERLGVPIVGPHIADRPLLESIERQAAMYGVGGGFRNAYPDTWLGDGDTLSFGSHRFEVLHCPGHAPGHVVFFSRATRFLHAGDVLFQGSVGRTDLPGGDHAALIASIREKLLPLGDDVAFICGHGARQHAWRRAPAQPLSGVEQAGRNVVPPGIASLSHSAKVSRVLVALHQHGNRSEVENI